MSFNCLSPLFFLISQPSFSSLFIVCNISSLILRFYLYALDFLQTSRNPLCLHLRKESLSASCPSLSHKLSLLLLSVQPGELIELVSVLLSCPQSSWGPAHCTLVELVSLSILAPLHQSWVPAALYQCKAWVLESFFKHSYSSPSISHDYSVKAMKSCRQLYSVFWGF